MEHSEVAPGAILMEVGFYVLARWEVFASNFRLAGDAIFHVGFAAFPLFGGGNEHAEEDDASQDQDEVEVGNAEIGVIEGDGGRLVRDGGVGVRFLNGCGGCLGEGLAEAGHLGAELVARDWNVAVPACGESPAAFDGLEMEDEGVAIDEVALEGVGDRADALADAFGVSAEADDGIHFTG